MNDRWHAADGDDDSWLQLDLGGLKVITGMEIKTAPENSIYGFKRLKTMMSTDGTTWMTIRTEEEGDLPVCANGQVSNHDGWSTPTRYVKIQMLERCGGDHYALSEWEVMGYAAP